MGRHTKKLQSAYDNFGMPLLEVLIECSESELDSNENDAINIFNAVDNGFNFNKAAEASPRGSGADSPCAALDKQKYVDILLLLRDRPELKRAEVAKLIGTSYGIVADIATGRTHKWLREVYPEAYSAVISLSFTRTVRDTSNQSNVIMSPIGILHTIHKSSLFAKEHKLDVGALNKVLCGERKTHGGWRLPPKQTA